MRSVRSLELSLSEIVDAIKTVEGVIGIILFGSVARGDYDEGSDIDLLVVFRDEDLMRRNEWEVTRCIPSDVFAQSICVCPSMLKSANLVFLRSVFDDGVILYMRLGRGCFLVPKESSESVLSLLKKYSLRYDLMEAYLPKVEKFPFEISL